MSAGTATSLHSVRGFAVPAAILAVWELSSHLGLVGPQWLPPIETVARTAVTEIMEGELLTNIGASLARNFTGFVLGGLAGLLFGLLLGLWRPFDLVFGPTFHALKQVSKIAWIPLITIWLSFGEVGKIFFIALAAFTPVVLNTYQGVTTVPVHLLEVGRALKFTRWQALTKIYLPWSAPSILTGVQLALIYSWLSTVGAEYFMSSGYGIGNLLMAGRNLLRMDLVLLGILALGAFGYLFNYAASRSGALLVRWR